MNECDCYNAAKIASHPSPLMLRSKVSLGRMHQNNFAVAVVLLAQHIESTVCTLFIYFFTFEGSGLVFVFFDRLTEFSLSRALTR